jgi:predicted TIM-barrel fold metal-dependent hydrolase
LAQPLPNADLILAHIGGGGDWAFSLKAVRPHPNIYVDLSGSVHDAGMVEAAYAAVGADRLLFGTDGSMCEGVGKLQGAEMPAAEKASVWGGNLQRLLGKREAGGGLHGASA